MPLGRLVEPRPTLNALRSGSDYPSRLFRHAVVSLPYWQQYCGIFCLSEWPQRVRADDDPPLFFQCFPAERVPGPGVKKPARIPCRGVRKASQDGLYVSDTKHVSEILASFDATFPGVFPARQGKY